MIYLNKIFKIPGPRDLGMSNSNYAMPSAFFSNDDSPTWEDYYSKVKKDYPIRYFISSTFIGFFVIHFNRIKRRISDIIYWFKYKFVYKYHVIDLRQPKNITFTRSNGISKTIINPDHYEYGWLDIDDKILYAIFSLLTEYVKHEMPPKHLISDDDVIQNPSLASHKTDQDEILAIYKWWSNDRFEEIEEIDRIRNKWAKLSELKRTEAKGRAHRELNNKEKLFEDKTDEMITRLMKIRRKLWS